MGKSLRKSGIDNIRDIPWGTHFCQFYQTKEDLMDILVPYFKAGLENNEFCMWVTSQPLGVEDAKKALRRAVPDIDAYLEKGQIEIIPYTYWYVKEGVFNSEKASNGWIEKLSQALANGYDGLRLSGDTFGLEKEGWNGFIEYEKEIDNIIGNFHMMALCTYPLDRCNATEIIDVVINHQFALIKREGKWEQIESSMRKKAEEEAAQAAKDWEYTFDIVPDLIAILDTEYGVVRVNKAMAARLGVTPEECVGLTCYRVVHGMDEPPSFCPHRQLLEDGLEHTKEVREESLGGDFIVTVSPLHDSEGKLTGCIHVAHDITERKRAEEAMRQSEQRVRLKLESILSPDREMTSLELADIVDVQAIQSFMDDFYKLAHIPIGITDLRGNVLVGVGWQDLCTKFHRVHPEACKHCVESDTKLSAGILPGEFKLYRCKNNMWDIVTPIMVGGKHVGNIFLGQFFFEDESLDYELFRAQARQYGFNEKEYIAAFEKVPRLSRETVNTIMAFFMKLANMISQLSYSNIKLAQSLSEREVLVDALRESEEKYRNLMETANEGIWVLEWILDAEARTTYVNEKMAEMLGCSREAMIGKSVRDFTDEDGKAIFEMNMKKRQQGINESHEFKLLRKDGLPLWALVNSKALFDKDGKFIGSISMHTDITKRKEAEDKLKEAYENLEKLVEERTTQLEKAYNSLKESEKGLAEAQKMAHIGNWYWDIATDKAYWSGEMYSIFGRDPQELAPPYNEYLSYIHPDDRDCFYNATMKAVNGKPYSIDHRIILANGEERTVHIQSEVITNEWNIPIQIKGIVQDITERKKAEKALVNLEIARKKEIHHRIKNNLQVISSLLDLQSEKFNNRKCVKDSEIMEAFRESQNRVLSMALIHEELHEGKEIDKLKFSPYLEKLAENLFKTYSLGNADIILSMDLEENVFFDMDIAVPLGIIINELISNSLKHAFVDRDRGEIRIKLYREKTGECIKNRTGSKKEECKPTSFVLAVSDDGIGVPESFDLKNPDRLGIQLVIALVDQLEGELELKRNSGTEFIIRFKVEEKQ